MSLCDASQLHGFVCDGCRYTFDQERMSPDHAGRCEECGMKQDALDAHELALDLAAQAAEDAAEAKSAEEFQFLSRGGLRTMRLLAQDAADAAEDAMVTELRTEGF